MDIKKFKELIIWQEARSLVKLIYLNLKDCKDFGFRDQIQRAAISVMNNIAEGFERVNNREFKRFLYFSKASCGEVRSMLYAGFDLKYINKENFQIMFGISTKISKMTSKFIQNM